MSIVQSSVFFMPDYAVYFGMALAVLLSGLSASLTTAIGLMVWRANRHRERARTQEELDAFQVMLAQNQRYFQSQMDSMSHLNTMLSEIKQTQMMIASTDEKLENLYNSLSDLSSVIVKRLQ